MPSWEKASEDYCTKTIADLGKQTDLFAQSKKFSPMVNAVLDHLKTSKFFKCLSVLTVLTILRCQLQLSEKSISTCWDWGQ